MTFKDCVESFPIYDTLIGHYESNQSFTISRGTDIDDIEEWPENPFWEDASCYAFVIFVPLIKKFECYVFCFDRVKGYINETADPEEFYPATYSEDFGWEIVDPTDPRMKDQVTIPDDELAIALGWPLKDYKNDKWRREQVAYLFDMDAYTSGYTFTSPVAIKKFVKERQDLL